MANRKPTVEELFYWILLTSQGNTKKDLGYTQEEVLEDLRESNRALEKLQLDDGLIIQTVSFIFGQEAEDTPPL